MKALIALLEKSVEKHGRPQFVTLGQLLDLVKLADKQEDALKREADELEEKIEREYLEDLHRYGSGS